MPTDDNTAATALQTDPRDPDPDGKGWLITRPCCGASGLLVRPNNAVHIPHREGCRYAH